MLRSFILLFSSLGLFSIAHADLSGEAASAANKTRDFLQNPQERRQFINENPAAQNVDESIQRLTGGGAEAEEIYRISSEVFTALFAQVNGNPERLQELVEQAQNNPEAFFESLPAEQRRMIQDISRQLETKSSQP